MVFRQYSVQERSDMLEIYLLNNKSATTARREYMRRFPEREAPSTQIFARLKKKLHESGSLLNVQKVCRNYSVLNDENRTNILAYYEAYPMSSINAVVQETGISFGSIQNVLKVHKYKPFKLRNTHKLNEEQKQRRLDFCANFLRRLNEDDNFLKNILWTDESSFSTKRRCNKQNARYWSTNNPRQIWEVQHQGYKSVTVWCGMVDRFILGPVFIDEKLTGGRYLRLLEHEIAEYIEDLPINVSRRIIWQQDGAPPHNIMQVKNFLNVEYAEGWIGNGGTIPWPANSPDLTVMDFFSGDT